jgi:stage II sporulation protein AA (anti-sigma F factor antagonist)
MPSDSRPLVQVDVVLPEEDDAPAVVRLRGELDLAEVRAVDDELARVIARTDHDVTIDVEDLQFIDVSGLNLLARTASTLTGADRALRLRAPSPILVRMLQVTGLDQAIQIVDPVDQHP